MWRIIDEITGAAIHGDLMNGIRHVAAPPNPVSDAQVRLFREAVVALVRRDGADLSDRQLGAFLICYLSEGGHTVGGLATKLNLSKSTISQVLDRLGKLGLARRKRDPQDRRCVLVHRTAKGAALLRETREFMIDASGEGKKAPRQA